MFDGQSFNYSQVAGERSYPVQLLELMGSRVTAGRTVAMSGTTYRERAASVAERVDVLLVPGTRSTVLDLAGQSDLLADLTGPQLFKAVTDYAEARHAAGAEFVVEFTIMTGGWYSPVQNVQRLAYNALLLANAGGHVDSVVDLAGRVELADATHVGYFLDGLHPTERAATLIADLAGGALDRLLV